MNKNVCLWFKVIAKDTNNISRTVRFGSWGKEFAWMQIFVIWDQASWQLTTGEYYELSWKSRHSRPKDETKQRLLVLYTKSSVNNVLFVNATIVLISENVFWLIDWLCLLKHMCLDKKVFVFGYWKEKPLSSPKWTWCFHVKCPVVICHIPRCNM